MKKIFTCFIKIFLGSFLLLVAKITFGQNSYCDKSNISKADKELIEQFWTDFKKAINDKDKAKLTSLIKFSFNCDYCILDSAKEKNYDYLTVTKTLFEKRQYKIFFDPKLVGAVNKYPNLFDILSITTDGTGEQCDLNFGYASVEPSKDWEGQQHFFSIKKIKGKFLITSAWTVP